MIVLLGWWFHKFFPVPTKTNTQKKNTSFLGLCFDMKLTRLHHKIYKILQVIQNRAVYQNHRFTQDSFWPIFPFVVVGRDFAPIRRPWCRRNGGQTSSHYWDCSAFYPLKHLETTECDVGDVGGLWSLIPSAPSAPSAVQPTKPIHQAPGKTVPAEGSANFSNRNVFVFFSHSYRVLAGPKHSAHTEFPKLEDTKKKWPVEVAGSMAWHSGKHIRIKHATVKSKWTTWEANVRSTKIQKKSKHILYVRILIHPKK